MPSSIGLGPMASNGQPFGLLTGLALNSGSADEVDVG